MKNYIGRCFSLCLLLAGWLPAQEPAAPMEAPGLAAEQLDQLLGPIALYPDALIALILPATTAPTDIVLAARYLKDNGDPADVGSRSWDDSVKSLAHYPEVVKWMDDNLDWTKQVGEAFLAQPAEVMKAVQRLREKAKALGTLANTAQQQVIMDGDAVTIVPAQPDVIYVPYYDPAIVYVERPVLYGNPYLTFSAAFAAGPWLVFDCDWRQRVIWTADRRWYSREHRDWRHPVFPGQPGYVNDPNRHPWKPPQNFSRMPSPNVYRPREDIIRPAPFPDAPPRTTVGRQDAPDRRPEVGDNSRRPDGRGRDQNPNRPVGTAVTTTAPAPNQQNPNRTVGAAVAATAPTIAPNQPQPTPTNRRDGPPQERGDPPDRPRDGPGVPVSRAPAAGPAPAERAASMPSQVPYGPPQSSRIVPGYLPPVIAPLNQSAPPPSSQVRPPPPPPPAQQPDESKKRSDQEKAN